MAKKTDDPVLKRINDARTDRDRMAGLINEVYRLGQPYRSRVTTTLTKTTQPITETDITDILDGTLQETIEDFASDMIATFTPPHEPWVRHEPSQKLTVQEQKALAQQLRDLERAFWEDMAKSTYYDAAYECFHDLASGTMAMCRKSYGATDQIIYEPLPTAQVLIDAGPRGGNDLRAYEANVKLRDFKAAYPSLAGRLPQTLQKATDNQDVLVQHGSHRLWDKKNGTFYRTFFYLNSELIYEKVLDGEGAPNVIVARWRSTSESAYGIGPAFKACPAARVLQELSALNLAMQHKTLDPPFFYSGDGTQNIEQGLDAGAGYDMGPDFKVEQFSPQGRFDVGFFTQEDLRMTVRRALYQDKPEQRGDTPPSATQWADQAERTKQRFEIPRGKLYTEWVMPTVVGHWWARSQQGVFPRIETSNGFITLVPLSPQAKARSFEDVARAERILALAANFMPQQTQIALNVPETIQNIKAALSDNLVAVRSDEEIAQIVQMQAQQQMEQPPA